MVWTHLAYPSLKLRGQQLTKTGEKENCPTFSAVTSINSWRVKSALSNVVNCSCLRPTIYEWRAGLVFEPFQKDVASGRDLSRKIRDFVGSFVCYFQPEGKSKSKSKPGRTFFFSSESDIRRFWSTCNSPIDGFWGSEVAKRSVRSNPMITPIENVVVIYDLVLWDRSRPAL